MQIQGWIPNNWLPALGVTTPGDTIRQKIIAALDARLQTILVANGYRTNLGQQVSEWDTVPMDQNIAVFALDYRDKNELAEYDAVGEHEHTLELEVRVRYAASTALAEIRKCLADVKDALNVDLTLGGLCDNITAGDWAADKGQTADTEASITATLKIEYSTDPWSS